MDTPLTHSELCLLAIKWLKNHGCFVAIKERSSNEAEEIPDAIGFKNGSSILIECKTSRGDFLADKRKYFRDPEHEERGMGEYRYYMSEPDVIKVDDLPPKWGLIHVNDGKAQKVRGCSSEQFKANYQAEKGLLYAIMRGLIVHEKNGTWDFINKEEVHA